MSNEAIAQVVDSYYVNMSAMNAEGVVKNFAEDAVICDPAGKPPNKLEDFPKFYEILSMVFEKLEVTKNNVFISGSGAAVKWTLNATGKNGKQATAEGISVFEINEDGKIKQLFSYWDDDAMMAQIKG